MISWVVPVSQLGEFSRDAVDVRFRARVRHGVNGKSDIEPALMRLACGRLDTDASGDAGDYDLRAPSLFRYSSRPVFVNAPHVRFVTVWFSDCPFSLGARSAPSGGELSTAASVFRSTRCSTPNVDEHDRQAAVAKHVSQRARTQHDLVDSVCGGQATMPFCRSMTTSAVLGSSVVSAMALSSW
jgi:hypothetical protein